MRKGGKLLASTKRKLSIAQKRRWAQIRLEKSNAESDGHEINGQFRALVIQAIKKLVVEALS